jgi:hypothetical protein
MTERYPVFLVNLVGHDYWLKGRCECPSPNNQHEYHLGFAHLGSPHPLGYDELPDEWVDGEGEDNVCHTCLSEIKVSGSMGYSTYDDATGTRYNCRTDPLPPGACYFLEDDYCEGPDGLSLIVVTPTGHWHVDSRASNCTLPDDKEHRCWVRHGHPSPGHPDGPLHVDKNGLTCAAGAGSIQMRDWHGFLHHGELYKA